jgi:hypothetical protein
LQWGCWTAEHEAENPSIGVVFPTIDRAKAAKDGVLSHYGLLCFAEVKSFFLYLSVKGPVIGKSLSYIILLMVPEQV